MSLALAITLVLGGLAFYVVTRPGMARSGLYLPDFAVGGLLTYVIGAGVFAIEGLLINADEVLTIGVGAFTSMCVGFSLSATILARRYPQNYTHQSLRQFSLAKGEEGLIYTGLALCGFVCVGFSLQVLGNDGVAALIPSLADLASGGFGDVLGARKAITNSTAGYFAPGYVKQFRDVFAPILFGAIMLISTRKRLGAGRMAFVLGIGLAAFVAMLLTGVRSSLFLFFVALFLAFRFAQGADVGGGRKKILRVSKAGRKKGLIFISLALFLYGFSTVLLGRIDAAATPFQLAFGVISNLFDRIVLTVPRENILAYPLWSSLQASSGEYWLADLGGVLPGSQGVTLSNLIHSYLGGSIEGNSVLGLPADIWVNWGWGGLVVFPLLYAAFLNKFDCELSRMRSPLALGIKATFAVGLVQIYSPYGFLLYGGAASLIVFAGAKFLHRGRRRRKSASRAHLANPAPDVALAPIGNRAP